MAEVSAIVEYMRTELVLDVLKRLFFYMKVERTEVN
jgi:hypothetical protein